MTVPDSNRIASHPVPPQEDPPDHPFSCSTNLSNDVDEHLGTAHLGSLASSFCFRMRRKTFGNAGWHRQQGHSELSCQFDLALWASEMGCDRSDLRKVREKLQAAHIITFDPYDALPGSGLLTWNTAFHEWQPYNQRIAKKLAGVVKFAQTEQEVTEKEPRSVVETAEKEPRQPAYSGAKRTTLASFVAASLQEPEDPLIKSYGIKEDVEESVANATQQKLWSSPRIPIAPLKKKLEQVARYKKTAATKEQIAAMWDAWEKQSGTAQRKNMSDKELKRFYAVMARLIDKGVTPEELASLAAALIRSSAWKSNYTARPSEVEDNLSTLRPIARGEVQPTQKQPNLQKGKTYERHDGTWTGNHGKDEAIVIKC